MSRTTTAVWEEAYAHDDKATYCHGPEWAAIWEEYSNGLYRPDPRLVVFPDGKRAVLAVTSQRTHLGLERWHLSPAGTFGGWVSGDELSEAQRRQLGEVIASHHTVVWRMRGEPELDPRWHRFLREDVTHFVDLRDGVEVARSCWSGNARRRAKHAAARGMRVRLATRARDWTAYLGVYKALRRRWSRETSSYGRSLFSILAELNSPSVRLFVAELDGEIVGGTITLSHQKTAIGWHSATLREVGDVQNLLHWEITAILVDGGFSYYDYNPSGEHSGVASFKESVGAVPLNAPVYLRNHILQRVAAASWFPAQKSIEYGRRRLAGLRSNQ